MRQLSAILFIDLVGYTSEMHVDEQLARTKRSRLNEALENIIPKHHGRIFQKFGDGALCIFQSAISAVLFAIDIQGQLRQEPITDARIGIHAGDVDIEGDSIYGDSVNIASRIETLATAGGIFISSKIFDEVKNHSTIMTQDLGYFELKHVIQPVKVYAIVNDGIRKPVREEIQGKTKVPSGRLAVLPFNSFGKVQHEFLADGLTEEIIHSLTQIKQIKVASRTSSFGFKNRSLDVRDIGRALNVDRVLEGSIRQSGNRMRVTAQLIDAINGYHLWSENFDYNMADPIDWQEQISRKIAEKVASTQNKPNTLRVAA